jgi:NADH-quinone oxidoreductase subunit A
MMPGFVLFILIFLVVGASLLAANLVLGRLLRPNKPSVEKGETYECGEVPVGSAWIQFDLRFYVVALLFVIFDVELAFFFPWAVVFGSANRAADMELSDQERVAIVQTLDPTNKSYPEPQVMHQIAWLAFADILVFFAVLLVGFAYLWRRGDLDWVRSIASQEKSTGTTTATPEAVR